MDIKRTITQLTDELGEERVLTMSTFRHSTPPASIIRTPLFGCSLRPS